MAAYDDVVIQKADPSPSQFLSAMFLGMCSFILQKCDDFKIHTGFARFYETAFRKYSSFEKQLRNEFKK